jgi:DNA polymerase III epsilon subunit-like protein
MDFETTGLLNPEGSPLSSQPKALEFAAIKLDDDLNELERMQFFSNPQCTIDDFITKLTGLRNSDVDDKPVFSYYYPQLCDFFCGCKTLIAHNLTFDATILRHELERIGKQYCFPWPFKQICTVEKTLHIHGYRLKLTLLHKELLGEPHENGAHRAMADVEALVSCVKKLREKDLL